MLFYQLIPTVQYCQLTAKIICNIYPGHFPFFLAISSVISLMFSSLGTNANWARPRRQSACGEDAQKPEVLEHNVLEPIVTQINAMTNNVVKTSVHDL